MKILIKSPFGTYSGYGNDGLSLARALVRWGADVYLQPTWVDVPFPPDLAPLLCKPLEPPFDLIINHWDPGNLGIAEEARRSARCAVAWSMWEFCDSPTNPNSAFKFFRVGQHNLRERLKWYDLVLGYDPVSVQAMKPYLGPDTPVGVLQGGYEAGQWPVRERDWHAERFGFMMHGALNQRKVPFLAVQAFNELKWEHPEEFAGATLSLHTTTPGLFPEMNNILGHQKIRVFYEMFSDAVLHEFYAANHCLLAPSRGEGKNLPALEMLSTGGTVAATNYGGHTMWLNEQFAYPLPYELQPTFPGRADGPHDARVGLEELKRTIWHIFTHRSEAEQKGKIGAQTIPSMCDWSVVVEDLFRRIRDLVPHNGELIYNMAQKCRRDPRDVEDSPFAAPPAGGARIG